jgi:hypothetical protein
VRKLEGSIFTRAFGAATKVAANDKQGRLALCK